MERIEIPVLFVRAFMSLMPAPVLARMIDILMHKMHRRHPRLFVNLGWLSPAVVGIEITDLPHSFILKFGGQPASLEVVEEIPSNINAAIKGDLVALIEMLEGQTDGDMLFFTRRLVVTGDTSVVIGLRNTMDRENINLVEDVTSLLGPFAEPANQALLLFNRVAKRIKCRLAEEHARLHADEEKNKRDAAT